jgi:hypothetical protein
VRPIRITEGYTGAARRELGREMARKLG